MNIQFSSNQPTMTTYTPSTIYWFHSSVELMLFYLSCLYFCLFYLSCLYFLLVLLSWIYRGCRWLAAMHSPKLLTEKSNISTTTNPPAPVITSKHARAVVKQINVPQSEKWIEEEPDNFVNKDENRSEESDGGLCSCCYIS